MQVIEKNKVEVEAKAKTMSDFVRMEYLELCLRKTFTMDVYKYCHKELSEICERRIMFPQAARHMLEVEKLSSSFKEKIEALVKSVELWIKGGEYNNAIYLYKKALDMANEYEKYEIRRKLVEILKKQGANLEKANQNANALKVYELLVNFVVDTEQIEVKKKLLMFYKKLGKIKESILLENEIRQ